MTNYILDAFRAIGLIPKRTLAQRIAAMGYEAARNDPAIRAEVDALTAEIEREQILAPGPDPEGTPLDIPEWATDRVQPRMVYQTVKVDDPELRVEAVYRRMEQMKRNHKREIEVMQSRIQHADRMQQEFYVRENKLSELIHEARREANASGRNQQLLACLVELYRVVHIGADKLGETDFLDYASTLNHKPRKPSKALVGDLKKLVDRWNNLEIEDPR